VFAEAMEGGGPEVKRPMFSSAVGKKCGTGLTCHDRGKDARIIPSLTLFPQAAAAAAQWREGATRPSSLRPTRVD